MSHCVHNKPKVSECDGVTHPVSHSDVGCHTLPCRTRVHNSLSDFDTVTRVALRQGCHSVTLVSHSDTPSVHNQTSAFCIALDLPEGFSLHMSTGRLSKVRPIKVRRKLNVLPKKTLVGRIGECIVSAVAFEQVIAQTERLAVMIFRA